jgi:hypothetical protein
MSYLRGLVRKLNAPRPQIAPYRAPYAAEPGTTVEEIVEELLVVPPRRSHPEPERSAPLPARDDHPAPPTHAAVLDVPAPPPVSPTGPVAVPVSAPPPEDAEPAPRRRVVMRRRLHPAPRPQLPDPTAEPIVEEIVETNAPAVLAPRAERRERIRRAPSVVAVVERETAGRFELRSRLPSVQISIGRIEVRANLAAPPKPERPAPFRPRLTLEDYLAQRDRERR